MKRKILNVRPATTSEILLLEIYQILEEILLELKKEGKDDRNRKAKKTYTE